MYYWTIIPKNRISYHASRGVREEDISKILQDEVVLNKDVDKAQEKLLATDGLQRFCNGLKTAKQKEDFRKHLRRYIQIYLPDCPWEVNSTNRYTIVTHEAAVTARRPLNRNESVKYLSGIQVSITPEEEKQISMRKKDFSIVVSSRSKSTSLFMGPARFANHDCNANAKLMTTGSAGIEIIAVRPIAIGEEITVTYGDSYFGEDNCECLCETCERLQRNGWEPEGGVPLDSSKPEEASTNECYSFRRRRRNNSADRSRTSSITPVVRPRILKTRKSSSMAEGMDVGNGDASVDRLTPSNITPRGRKRRVEELATPPITPAKKLKHLLNIQAESSCSRGSSVTGSVASSSRDVYETEATSPRKTPDLLQSQDKLESGSIIRGETLLESHANVDAPISPPSSQQEVFSPKLEAATSGGIFNSTEQAPGSLSLIFRLAVDKPVAEVTPLAISIETVEQAGRPTDQAARPTRKYVRRTFLKQATPPLRQRTKGDYRLTSLLLSEPEMAWIQCTNCETHFVQQNAYFTRSACPRCERHSKLYGYKWPKVDKAGSSDREERILDHRLVHRFLDADNERKARGRKSMNNLDVQAAADVPLKRGRPPTLRKVASEATLGNGDARKRREAAQEVERKRGKSQVAIVMEEDTSGLRRSGRERRVSSRVLLDY